MSAVFNEPHEFTQPQTGEKFTLIVDGDEFGATFTTPAGYAVRFNLALDLWVYCDRASNGRLILTPHPAHLNPPEGLVRGLCEDADAVARTRNERVHARYFRAGDADSPAEAALTIGADNGLLPGRKVRGDVTGLVVIVDFADEPAFDNAIALADQLYNGPEPHLSNSTTVRGYFQAVSDNKFNFTNRVHPTVVHLPHKKSYYMRHSIVPIVMQQIKDDVTFADYDSKGEWYIDSLTFLYAGPTVYGDQNAGTDALWPHNSTHRTDKLENGRWYRTHYYMLTSLGASAAEMTIGTSCHELCHLTLRYPDLYDYGFRDGLGIGQGRGKSDGIGPYCVMGNGNHVGRGTTPVPPCAYLRNLSRFIDNEVILNGVNARHEIRADDYSTIFRYVISPNESFVIENHSAVGLRAGMATYRRRMISGIMIHNISGLAIMHCDTEGSNEWQENTPSHHYQTYLLEADGRMDLERNQGANARDLYSDVEGVAASFDTIPSTRRWDRADSGLVIRDVSAPGEAMTFVSGGADTVGDDA